MKPEVIAISSILIIIAIFLGVILFSKENSQQEVVNEFNVFPLDCSSIADFPLDPNLTKCNSSAECKILFCRCVNEFTYSQCKDFFKDKACVISPQIIGCECKENKCVPIYAGSM